MTSTLAGDQRIFGKSAVSWLSRCTKRRPPANRNFKYRRALVSQDRDENFVTFAEYDHRYLSYLKGEQGPISFLTLHEFGPWNIQDAQAMGFVGTLALAIAKRR